MTTKSGKRSLALATLLALLAGRVSAQTTYYVDAAQPDNNCNGLCAERDGTPCTCGPKEVINSAMLLAVDGDTVKVLPGTYNGEHKFWSDGVTLEAVGEAIITGVGMNSEAHENITVRGFTFQDIISQHGLTVHQAVRAKVEYCRFIQCPWGMQGGTSVIRHCLFDRCGTGTVGGSVIENCTFYQCDSTSGAIVTGGWGVLATIRNNVFVENTLAIDNSSGQIWVYYNNFYGNVNPLIPGDVVSKCENTEDPLFIDAPNGVFYVKDSSPLLNQGRNGGLIGAYGRGFHTSKDETVDEPDATATRPRYPVARLGR